MATEQRLNGKVALITGAASGIGRTAALLFAHEGASVAAFDLDSVRGKATVGMITEQGYDARFWTVDVTRDEQVREAVADAVNAFGRLDVAFNVVGASGRRHGDGPIHACTEEGWDWTIDVNLKSMYLCCKYEVQQMLAQGGGAIVNLSSVLGLVGGDEDFATHAYATSKGGVISLTRSIASYYASQTIRANVICPSLIATNMSRRAQSNDTIRDRLPSLQPLTSDFGSPDDVAHAALYLASDHAAFVTGAVLTVDGGWTVR